MPFDALPTAQEPLAARRNVLILLATYHGAAFLDEQLRSIEEQGDIGQIDVLASDDGSTDATLTILQGWAARWRRGRFDIQPGPKQGFAENFRSLIVAAAQRTADYFAFADQDDLWDRDKLTVAISSIAKQPADRPSLYCSRTRLVDSVGRFIGYSPLFRRPPAFENAIVQSIGGGNTIVLNASGFAVLAESARRTSFQSHDWWAYILISGAGGHVHYDATAHIAYRQHGSNVVGKNTGILPRLSRLRKVLAGRFAEWTDRNLSALEACRDLLTPTARQTLDELTNLRRHRGFAAWRLLRQARLYRQTLLGHAALTVAAFIGKV